MALLRRIDPERAHRIAINALRFGLFPRSQLPKNDPILKTKLFGITFQNPIGLAAGFDKSAEAFESLLSLGCGFVEVGTLTPNPQSGNAKPRAFRLKEDRAAINRLGFNNEGLTKGLKRLSVRKKNKGIVGINIGINKGAEDPIKDYTDAVYRATPFADYLTVNVSSPNTVGLRDLQAADQLEKLSSAVIQARDTAAADFDPPPLLLKIAPDLSSQMVIDIVEIAIEKKIDGLIISNTTVSRPEFLISKNRYQSGGLSGKPLFNLSNQALAKAYLAGNGRIGLIGVGGIDSVQSAYTKIRAGASIVQIYTGLMYNGPSLFDALYFGLANTLRNHGFSNITNAVGLDAEAWSQHS